MFLCIVEPHRATYADPVAFSSGDRLRTGRRDEGYPGWIWVHAEDGREGWAPEDYLDRDGIRAVALKDYDAAELDTSTGEQVELIESLNGWVRVRNSRGRSGWIPASTTAPARG